LTATGSVPILGRVRLALVGSVLAALVLTGVASASRAPSGAESKAIRAEVTGFINMPNSPASKTDKIVSIRISTVDPRYASVRLNSTTVGPSVMVLHRSVGSWWVLEFGSSLGCDTAPKAVMDNLKVGCSPPDGVAWIPNCGPLASAPRDLLIACADANYSLADLTWSHWGAARTTATGVARANDCTPNCAAGRFHTYRMTATADELRRCGTARYYARLTIVYPAARPKGIGKRDVIPLSC
jgi:hypothetical protein